MAKGGRPDTSASLPGEFTRDSNTLPLRSRISTHDSPRKRSFTVWSFGPFVATGSALGASAFAASAFGASAFTGSIFGGTVLGASTFGGGFFGGAGFDASGFTGSVGALFAITGSGAGRGAAAMFCATG